MSNNYSAPESALVTAEASGGSLEAGIAGDYEFKVFDVLGEAWEKTKGVKRYILGGGIAIYVGLYVAITVAFVIATIGSGGGNPPSGAGMLIAFLLIAAVMIAMLPLGCGLFTMALKHIQGQKAEFGDLFTCFNKTASLVIAAILMNLMIMVGMFLFLLPGIYLSFAYFLAIPLIVDRGMGPWEAMEASRKALTKRWFSVVGFYIMIMLIIFVSSIPLGIGLIWTMPMTVLAMAILYRQVFGIVSY